MKARMLLSAALMVLLCWAAPSSAEVRPGMTAYRVKVVLYPGDDGAAVAKRLAAIYRGTLETPVDSGGGFVIALSAAAAGLMGRDPAVERLEVAEPTVATGRVLETTAVATPWKLGNFEYDGSGNIRRIGADFFAYDSRNRLLVSADASASTVVHKQTYAYDTFGNLTTIATAGDVPTTLTVDTSSNQVTSVGTSGAAVSPVYDPAGNMTQYGTATYTYDALNVLTRSTIDGVTRYYVYSANDERIGTVEVSAVGTRSDWTIRDAGGQVLRRFSRESNSDWKWQEDYIYRGSQMLAAEVPDATKIRHCHLDHLGTPRLITGNGGVELSRHNYHPFGVEIAPTSTSTTTTIREKKQFTGHERDAESLDYMHARFYAPYMGRFLSVDPVITKQAVRLPQHWNRYAYAGDNPMNRVDPDGRLLQLSECAKNTASSGCTGQYNLLLSTFGKQSTDAAKHLSIGKNGIINITGMSGGAFATKFGLMGRATDYLVSNRVSTFTINTGRTEGGANFVARQGGGGDINVDVAAFKGGKMLGGVSVSATEALVHEMAHGLSTLIQGHSEALNSAAGTSLLTRASPRNEAYATVFENAWRRATYGLEIAIRDGYFAPGDVRDISSPELFP